MSIAYDYAARRSPACAASPTAADDGGTSCLGRTFKTFNPANEQVIATVAEGNEADVDRAVAAARRAFEGPWRSMRASERGQILLRLADLMKKHADEMAALERLDDGKPIAGVLRQDLPVVIDTLRYYAGWADKISGEIVSDAGRCAHLHRARAGRRGRADHPLELPADDRRCGRWRRRWRAAAPS